MKPLPAGATARSPLLVDVVRAGSAWAPSAAQIRTWASAALGRRAAGAVLAVRVVRPAESKRLNARYRGRDSATNVLSFPVPALPRMAAVPGGAPRPLGDLVICASVVRAEAHQQHKSIKAHWAHLVIHGALHLLGYDHERDDEARRMERREVAVLKRFGITNPYRSV
ncbi:MAG TPA: rRNA maturation RNase YbeY [Steroidobacteraceae bacterium]|jgi:probable rRNA maturation factor|nr:rRNA maturation RNase YbeY [Steroidobacteraceae bacterium]